MDDPQFVAVAEELVLLATLTAQPVVDRIEGDRRGPRSEVLRRRGGDASQLLEAPCVRAAPGEASQSPSLHR